MMRDRTRETAVKEFHTLMGHQIGGPFSFSLKEVELRMKLINEECAELSIEGNALSMEMMRDGRVKNETVIKFLKELADLQYVISGCAVALGLPLGLAFNRVHASNMSKMGVDGKPLLRGDGKVLKGSNYKEPQMEDLL